MAGRAADGTKKNHIIAKLVALLLAAVLAYGGWLGLSAHHVMGMMEQAEQSYQSMQAHFEAQEYEAAMTDVREAASASQAIAAELGGIQWDVAEKIPVLGTEVQTARSLGAISDTFSNEGVLPVLDAWETLAADDIFADGQVDFDKLSGKVEQLGTLVDMLQAASEVTNTCSEQLASLPTSRFDQINQANAQLTEAVTSTKASLDDLSGVLGLMGGASDLFSGLLGTGTGATGETTTEA